MSRLNASPPQPTIAPWLASLIDPSSCLPAAPILHGCVLPAASICKVVRAIAQGEQTQRRIAARAGYSVAHVAAQLRAAETAPFVRKVHTLLGRGREALYELTTEGKALAKHL